MKRPVISAISLIFVLALSLNLHAQPEVSERNEVAIFSLGFYGYDIPVEALSTIDIEIQRVFIDLGRFTIMGMTQRFDSASVNDFIDSIKRSKEENFVMPDKFLFGEAFFTDAEYNKLMGAFIIAVPVVTSFNSELVENDWKTDIKTNVSFINVQDGTLMGIANVESSGSSRETQFKSIKSAIDNIPMQLQYEIRKIPAFQLRTKVLEAKGSRVELMMGSGMGIKVGDEYAIKKVVQIGEITDESEVGLILIKEVRENSSTGTVLYTRMKPGADTQLQEIPRLGADTAVYLHYSKYFNIPGLMNPENAGALIAGARAELTRGFYNFRPYAAVEVVADLAKWFPINIVVGGQYSMYLGRLELGGRVGIAGSANVVVNLLEDEFAEDDDKWFTHYGVSGGAYLSFLINRNTKIFAEVQADLLFGLFDGFAEPFNNFGGYGAGLGITFKL
ncbi:MAG: hypothetical protein KKI09_16250 [Spirochaetes bacterium]|nr:hypothetical protein [Spirochaetota bacterium]